MWVLRQINVDNNNNNGSSSPAIIKKDTRHLYLRQGVHTFGRQASKVSVLLTGDQGVSREHATINVSYIVGPGKEEQIGIFIRDGTENKERSSTGTYVNDKKVDANFSKVQDVNGVWRRLKMNDVIRIGPENGLYSFKVCQIPGPVFMTSKVKKPKIGKIKQLIGKMGGALVKKHIPGKTDFLVMETFSSTFKCILALTDMTTTIVNCKYVEDMSKPNVYVNCISKSKSEILPTKYQVERLMTSSISSRQTHQLPLNENNATYKKYKWSVWRVKLFDGITFILLNKPDPNMNYATLLENCGGNVLHCYDNINKFPSLNDVENIKSMVYVVPPSKKGATNNNLSPTSSSNEYLKEIEKFNLFKITNEDIAKRIVDKKPIPLNDSDHVNGSMSQFAIASSMSSLEAVESSQPNSVQKMVVDTSSSSNNHQKYKTFDDANNKDGQTEKIKNNANSSATAGVGITLSVKEKEASKTSPMGPPQARNVTSNKKIVPPKQILMENDPPPAPSVATNEPDISNNENDDNIDCNKIENMDVDDGNDYDVDDIYDDNDEEVEITTTGSSRGKSAITTTTTTTTKSSTKTKTTTHAANVTSTTDDYNNSDNNNDGVSYYKPHVTGWVNREKTQVKGNTRCVVLANLKVKNVDFSEKNGDNVSSNSKKRGKKKSRKNSRKSSNVNYKPFRKNPVPVCAKPVSYNDMYENENELSQRALQLQAQFNEDDAKQKAADLAFWDDDDNDHGKNGGGGGNAFQRMMANTSTGSKKTGTKKRKGKAKKTTTTTKRRKKK